MLTSQRSEKVEFRTQMRMGDAPLPNLQQIYTNLGQIDALKSLFSWFSCSPLVNVSIPCEFVSLPPRIDSATYVDMGTPVEATCYRPERIRLYGISVDLGVKTCIPLPPEAPYAAVW